MNLCKGCYANLKNDPTLIRKGIGISKFNGYKVCDVCTAHIERFIVMEKKAPQGTVDEEKSPEIDFSKGNFFKSNASRGIFQV